MPPNNPAYMNSNGIWTSSSSLPPPSYDNIYESSIPVPINPPPDYDSTLVNNKTVKNPKSDELIVAYRPASNDSEQQLQNQQQNQQLQQQPNDQLQTANDEQIVIVLKSDYNNANTNRTSKSNLADDIKHETEEVK